MPVGGSSPLPTPPTTFPTTGLTPHPASHPHRLHPTRATYYSVLPLPALRAWWHAWRCHSGVHTALYARTDAYCLPSPHHTTPHATPRTHMGGRRGALTATTALHAGDARLHWLRCALPEIDIGSWARCDVWTSCLPPDVDTFAAWFVATRYARRFCGRGLASTVSKAAAPPRPHPLTYRFADGFALGRGHGRQPAATAARVAPSLLPTYCRTLHCHIHHRAFSPLRGIRTRGMVAGIPLPFAAHAP